MTTNLLDMLSQAITPELVGGLGKLFGESESALGSGISALLPGLIGAMANKASTSEGASALAALVDDPRIEADLTERLPTLVRSVQAPSLLSLGNDLLNGLFGGGRSAALGSALAGSTGIRAASASGLAAAITPMVFSLIKRLVGERALDPKGLAALLLGQRDFLRGKLDPGLLAALGLGTPTGLLDGLGATATRLGVAADAAGHAAGHVGAGHATGVAGTAGAAAATAQAGSGGFGRVLPWLVGAAVVLYLLSQLSNCGGTPTQTPILPSASSGAAPAATAGDAGAASSAQTGSSAATDPAGSTVTSGAAGAARAAGARARG